MAYYHREATIPDARRTLGEEWTCDWVDPESGQACAVRGTLRQRSGVPYGRHDCYGHEPGGDRTFRRTYFLCREHWPRFLATHASPSRARA